MNNNCTSIESQYKCYIYTPTSFRTNLCDFWRRAFTYWVSWLVAGFSQILEIFDFGHSSLLPQKIVRNGGATLSRNTANRVIQYEVTYSATYKNVDILSNCRCNKITDSVPAGREQDFVSCFESYVVAAMRWGSGHGEFSALSVKNCRSTATVSGVHGKVTVSYSWIEWGDCATARLISVLP